MPIHSADTTIKPLTLCY